MADFVGTWKCKEHLVKHKLTIGTDFEIKLEQLTANQYKVTMPPPVGSFVEMLNGQTISHKWTDVPTKDRYGLRLVFDHTATPTIVAGPLGSVIERWPPHPSRQPEDMGTITGTKGL